ncbi:MAG: 2-hydroxyhepta-2,4-diene-1,7-dioate isomerase [Bacteroidetes bacterium]|nr:2-hydroxyhepta-2,4-diene-1,7-dioate isomerase [Bacteroidota bacterium]
MKIICIGRNYGRHALELGNEIPDEPVVFLKPDSALMRQRDAFFIPDFSNDIHYEAEIVIRIDRVGKNIQEKFARKYFTEISIGIDFTARDVQSKLKQKGLPWEKAKGFDSSAVVGNFINASELDLTNLNFEFKRNGETVQKGNTSDMLFPVNRLISHVSEYFTLKIGDLVYTGTPEGVGKVNPGDLLEGFIEGEKLLEVRVR